MKRKIAKGHKGLNIRHLKDKHKGETIFVLGSGTQMDMYRPDFFKDRISIGCNFVYHFFPVLYTVTRHKKVLEHETKPKNLISPEITIDFFGFNMPQGDYVWRNEIFESGSTIMTAVDVARYMGAQRIYVIGAEMYGRHMNGYNEFVSPQDKGVSGEISTPYLKGTKWMFERFKKETEDKYKIEIYRNEMIIEDIIKEPKI